MPVTIILLHVDSTLEFYCEREEVHIHILISIAICIRPCSVHDIQILCKVPLICLLGVFLAVCSQ